MFNPLTLDQARGLRQDMNDVTAEVNTFLDGLNGKLGSSGNIPAIKTFGGGDIDGCSLQNTLAALRAIDEAAPDVALVNSVHADILSLKGVDYSLDRQAPSTRGSRADDGAYPELDPRYVRNEFSIQNTLDVLDGKF